MTHNKQILKHVVQSFFSEHERSVINLIGPLREPYLSQGSQIRLPRVEEGIHRQTGQDINMRSGFMPYSQKDCKTLYAVIIKWVLTLSWEARPQNASY